MSSQENHNTFIYEGLKQSIKETSDLIRSLMEENKDTQIDVATLETKLDDIGKDVEQLSKILRDGNGVKSVLTRLALIEENINDIYEMMDDSSKSTEVKLQKMEDENKRKERSLIRTKDEESAYNKKKILSL